MVGPRRDGLLHLPRSDELGEAGGLRERKEKSRRAPKHRRHDYMWTLLPPAIGARKEGMSEANPSAPEPVPKSEIHEDSITNFDKEAGDSSKGIMIAVLVFAALMILGIFIFSEPQSTQEAVQSGQK